MSTTLQSLSGVALGSVIFLAGFVFGASTVMPSSVAVELSEVPSSITIRHTGIPSQVCLDWVSSHFKKPVVHMFDVICNGSR